MFGQGLKDHFGQPNTFYTTHTHTQTLYSSTRTPESLPCCFYINFILTCIFTENGTEITGFEYLEVITVPYFKHFNIKFLSSDSMYIIYTPGATI